MEIKNAKWQEVNKEIKSLLYNHYLATGADNASTSLVAIMNNRGNFLRLRRFNVTGLRRKNSGYDPIQLYSSIHGAQQSNETRLRKINLLLRALGSANKYKEIDFTGCPSPVMVQLLAQRDSESQKAIWLFFARICEKQQDGLLKSDFDTVKEWYGINVVSLTIFLFWIDPGNFLPLDKNTVGFLLSTETIKERPKNVTDYKKLLVSKNSDLYIEIARIAFEVMQLGTKDILYSNELRLFITGRRTSTVKSSSEDSSGTPPDSFKIVALRLYERLTDKYRKVLTPGEYKLFDYYQFLSPEEVVYETPIKNLYKAGDLNVEISAIVGKNGTGKSSITELIFIAINNLAWQFMDKKEKDLEKVREIFLDFYFITDSLYVAQFRGKSGVIIKRFAHNTGKYHNPQQVELADYSLNRFFYTIAINYSHFALNSKNLGDWIAKLFHKNDGYQTPIVLNPFRAQGDIKINREESLAKSRLLFNILQPPSFPNEKVESTLRMLTDTKFAAHLEFKIDKDKFEYVIDNGDYQIYFIEIYHLYPEIIEMVWDKFKLPGRPNLEMEETNSSINYAQLYIAKKVITISLNYQRYRGRFNPSKFKFHDLNKYIDELKIDNSHITFKLKQAIHFIKYKHIEKRSTNFSIPVTKLTTSISNVMAENKVKEELRIQYIPPSFFDVTIKLMELGSDKLLAFQDLSSGEKQRIYTASSVTYHLINLDSVPQDEINIIAYRNVQIILDEIELYFHPDMQRSLIKYLLWYSNKLKLINISNISICFITHSPFILSDIPRENVLFLGREASETFRTFGANIHELLINGFFMKRTIGAFVESQILEVLAIYNQIFPENVDSELENDADKVRVREIQLETIKGIYNKKRDILYFVARHLGETYLRTTVTNHLIEIDKILNLISEKDLRIEELKAELKRLEN